MNKSSFVSRQMYAQALFATLMVCITILSTPMISLASANQIDLNSSVHLADKTQFISPSPSITDPTEKHNWTETEVLDLYSNFKTSGSFAEYPFTWDQIQYIIDNKIDVPVEYLTAEVMTGVAVLADGRYNVSRQSGLKWVSQPTVYSTLATARCYSAIDHEVIDDEKGRHHAFQFPVCWSGRYQVYLCGVPIRADRRDGDKVLVSGWSMCFYAFCSTWLTQRSLVLVLY